MKKTYILPIVLLIISCNTRSLWSADLLPPIVKSDTKITFHVVTDDGKPAQNILVYNWTIKGSPQGNIIYDKASGTTASNGVLTLALPSLTGLCEFGVRDVSGYYSTVGNYQFTNAIDGKWQPWNPIIDMVVKPILNPIPMYARAVGAIPNILKLPQQNTAIGFDLEAADFVTPYGNGTVSDFIFTLTAQVPFVSYRQPFDISLNLSFSNKGDGIQSVIAPLNQGSAFRLPRYAPESGYQPTLVQETAIFANGKSKNTQLNEKQNYLFRVRTVLDEQGNVKSALYGKISGPIQFRSNGRLQFTYYLNPTPNDRNMEFDPKRNLFTNLPILQQVKAP